MATEPALMEPHINQDVPKIDLNPVTFLKNRESGKIGRTAAVRPKGIYIPSDRIWGEVKATDFSPYTRFSWKSRIDIEGTKIYNGAIITTGNQTTIHTYDDPVIMVSNEPTSSAEFITSSVEENSPTIGNSSPTNVNGWEANSSRNSSINNSPWEEGSSTTVNNWDAGSWDSTNSNWEE